MNKMTIKTNKMKMMKIKNNDNYTTKDIFNDGYCCQLGV